MYTNLGWKPGNPYGILALEAFSGGRVFLKNLTTLRMCHAERYPSCVLARVLATCRPNAAKDLGWKPPSQPIRVSYSNCPRFAVVWQRFSLGGGIRIVYFTWLEAGTYALESESELVARTPIL